MAASAHLAEQVGNKIGVPILTLSSDTTTTEINLPWIFRLGPTDAVQAQAFARDIYQNQKLQRVVLLTQNDHDGRPGGEEFEKARTTKLNAAGPQRIVVEPEKLAGDEFRKTVEGVQAVVVWTDAPTANLLVARLREDLPNIPLYLSRKAAQGDWSNSSQPHAGHAPAKIRESGPRRHPRLSPRPMRPSPSATGSASELHRNRRGPGL